MTWTGAIVLYSCFFFLVLLVILPFGTASQQESGDVEPGTPASAPSEVNIQRKFLWSAIGALALVGLVTLIMEFEIVTLRDLDFLMPHQLRTGADG
ncbi:MAG: DUF1467 family protein [Neomegalonema sp.]|nr:DUF1467 family protein [Neomegalonema sp.]